MEEGHIEKLVFVDTSIFLLCAVEQLGRSNLGTLKKFLEKLDGAKMRLIVPENIKVEILYKINESFDGIKENIKGSFEKIRSEIDAKKSNILDKPITGAEHSALEEIESIRKTTNQLIDQILRHKRTEIIEISNELMLAGIRRALLKRAPFTDATRTKKRVLKKRSDEQSGEKEKKEDVRKRENPHTVDYDCIAFESILHFLRGFETAKGSEFIICANDSDFLLAENEPHSDIKEDLERLCASCTGYNDPLRLLEKEFGENYSQEQLQEHEAATDTSDPLFTGTAFGFPYVNGNVPTVLRISPYEGMVPRYLPKTEVCSKCGSLFQEIDDNNSFISRSSAYVRYLPWRPIEKLCKRCRDESSRPLGL